MVLLPNGNFFSDLISPKKEEVIQTLLEKGPIRIERIISLGQATPPGHWYDQEQDEWVILLRGKAVLAFETSSQEMEMGPGDFVFLPAHFRHSVVWTSPQEETIWLAFYFQP